MLKRKPFANAPAKSLVHDSLTCDEIVHIICDTCKVSCPPIKGDSNHYVVFTPNGWDMLAASVHYGKWIAENELESQCFLEGYYFVDSNNISTTVVTDIITPISASQEKAFAQLYSESNNAYAQVEQKEQILRKFASSGKNNSNNADINPFYKKYGPPIRIGFNHTHPNIGTFFSSVDRTSVFAAKNEPWITMVVDPRREEILAAVGPDLDTAKVIIFNSIENPFSREYSTNDIFHLIEEGIKHRNQLRIKITGSLPGKIKFKGTFYGPRKRSKAKTGR